MRRLVILTHQYPAPRGDAPFVDAEIDALAAEFDDVVVFSFDANATDDSVPLPPNVRVGGNLYTAPVALSARLGGFLRLLPTTLRVLRAERQAGRPLPWRATLRAVLAATKVASQPALRHALATPEGSPVTLYCFWGMGATLAAPWLPRPSGGLVVRLHGYDLYDAPDRALPFRASLFDRADRVLFVSEAGRAWLASQPWARHRRAELIVAPLGTPDVGVSPEPRSDDPPTVMTCSSITAVKRVPLIAGALGELATRRPIRWLHFGDGPELSRVREVLADAPQTLQVELRGQVPRGDVLNALQTPIAVFVNASSSEGLPVSLMEAVSAGVPCVATDVGGTAELVGERHGTGILLPATPTASELARAIETVLERPLDRSAVRQRWAEAFRRDVTGPHTARIIGALTKETI